MPKEYDHLEQLLKAKESKSIIKRDIDMSPKILPKTQAHNSADLEDFIAMVGKIVTKALKADNVYFCPDEGRRILTDTGKQLESPHIYFEVLDCKPKNELKPRTRKDFIETRTLRNQTVERQGSVQGQRFIAHVQFNIFGCDYKQVNKVMKNFEELIFNYTSYFKREGVAELLFENRFTDKNYDGFRQKMSVRSLQYYVEIERNYVVYDQDIVLNEMNGKK